MQEDAKPLVLTHVAGKKELRGFAQLMGDGKWSPRGSVVRHLDALGESHETPLPLGEVTFDTEEEAAKYGFNAAMTFSESKPI